MTPGQTLVAINVGNTRTQIGQFVDGQLKHHERLPNGDLTQLAQLATQRWTEIQTLPGASMLLASVNDPVAEQLALAIEDATNEEVFLVGDDVPVPIGQQLDPETITGIDRLLNAAAAFEHVKQACVIVDAGTAITVDFVDGEGTFHGGAIAPGATLQLKSLHQHTAALPELAFKAPNKEPFGRNTAQAMYQGVFHGIRGMVQRLVEQYAQAFGAFPMVIATGGDAQTLFGDDELVDRIVPDLTLLGIAATARFVASDEDTIERRKDASP
jgi:type III pantothenate kinase